MSIREPLNRFVTMPRQRLGERLFLEIAQDLWPVVTTVMLQRMGMASTSGSVGTIVTAVGSVSGIALAHALHNPAERFTMRLRKKAGASPVVIHDKLSKGFTTATFTGMVASATTAAFLMIGNTLVTPAKLVECSRPDATAQVAGKFKDQLLCAAKPQ